MTFWQENYAFIKDVYDTRAQKLNELMDKTESSIGDVMTDKIYTSAEFKKVKEIFQVGRRRFRELYFKMYTLDISILGEHWIKLPPPFAFFLTKN